MRVSLLTLVFVCGLARMGSAAPIVYNFTGTLTGSAPSTESNAALRELTAGDQFTGSFWYSFTVPPIPEGSPTGGTYVPNGDFTLVYEFVFDTLTISGQGGFLGPSTAPFVQIGNGTTDTFALGDLSPRSAVGNVLDEFLLNLVFAPDAWVDRSMPVALPTAAFQGGSFRITILTNPCTGGACYDLSGRIDSLESSSVPEPSVLLLAGVGAAASFLRARAARRRKTAR